MPDIPGSNARPIFEATFLYTRYSTSESEIPPIVVQILLFIENRAMLDPRYPSRNPAIELTPKRLP